MGTHSWGPCMGPMHGDPWGHMIEMLRTDNIFIVSVIVSFFWKDEVSAWNSFT